MLFNILIEFAGPRILWGKQISQHPPPNLQRMEVIFTFWKPRENQPRSRSYFGFFFFFLCVAVAYFLHAFIKLVSRQEKPRSQFSSKLN